MQAVAEALIAAMPARARVGASRMTGLGYTLTNEGLRAHASEISAGRYAAAVRWWCERFPDETELPMPAEDLVKVISALSEGLTFQRLLTPDLIPDAVIFAAFAALAVGRPKPTA